MNFVIFIIETLANVSQSFAILYFLTKTLKVNDKVSRKIAMFAGAVIFFTYLELQYIIVPFEGLGIIILWMLLFVYAVLFLDGNISQKMYISLFIIVVILFTSLLVGSITAAIYGIAYRDFVIQNYFGKYICIVILQVVIWIMTYVLSNVLNRYNSGVRIKDTFAIIGVMLIAIVIMNELQVISYSVEGNLFVKEVFVIILGVTAMLLLCMILYEVVQKSSHKMMEQALIEQTYKSQLDNIADIKANSERIAKIKHEFNKTLSTASIMLKTGHIEDAQEFLNQFDDELSNIIVEKIYTDNIVINSLLTKKVEECREKYIDIIIVINGNISIIKNVDLYCVLSNLIDNAIEAEERVEDKRIEINIDENDNLCSVKVSNNINQEMFKRYEDGVLFNTNKKDKVIHGYGLKNVKDITERYHGKIKYDILEHKVLTCSVILYSENIKK